MDEAQAVGGSPVPFRVVSWNMNHWRQPTRPEDTRAKAWAYLRDELRPDVALLQETVPPASVGRGSVIYREIADYRPWGSAVVARDGLPLEEVWAVRTRFSRRRFHLANTFPGSVAVGEVALDGVAPITVVSVYNVIDVYAQTTLLRTVADLIPLFDSAKGSRVILAGDLNMSTATQDPYYTRRGAAILGALGGLGLVEVTDVARQRPASLADCRCGAGGTCRHVPTWNGLDLDHVYVTESLRDEVAALAVRHDAVSSGLSDHSPLVVDLALSRTPAPRQWDREAVAAEFGRLLGPDAGRTVEELAGWAEDKERRVVEAGRRGVTLTRFPCSTGLVPEMWLQVDYAGERVPMYTVSLKGNGQVVVQFQWMLYPPFDTPEGREGLREHLNRIPGVAIPADKLSGRPAFPLSVLATPGALAQLVGVLERIVDETIPVRSGSRGVDTDVDDPGVVGAPPATERS